MQEVAIDISLVLEKMEADARRESVELALREIEERYRSLVETSFDWI